MCGPLALAVPATGKTKATFVLGRLVYSAGRISTYAAIGAVFGSFGKALALMGAQRWLSLAAGATLLIGVFAGSKLGMRTPLVRVVGRLKEQFGLLLKIRTLGSLWLLGVLNGLLPCGLVYVAATAGIATGSAWGGALHMSAFGAGTLPVMVGIGLLGRPLQLNRWMPLRRWLPLGVACLGLLMVVRGMALGIPYLSPSAVDGQARCPACAK